jgi:hypothetical protein
MSQEQTINRGQCLKTSTHRYSITVPQTMLINNVFCGGNKPERKVPACPENVCRQVLPFQSLIVESLEPTQKGKRNLKKKISYIYENHTREHM